MHSLTLLARHIIAAIGGMLAHHGVTVDDSSTGSIIAGLLFLSVSVLWSYAAKMEMSDDARDIMKKACGALASQLVAAAAGWLQVDAATAADPVALSVFAANLTLARVRGHVPPAKLGQWTSLFLLFSLSAILPACSSTSQEALKQRLEEAFVRAGREVSAVALQSAIATLKHELALLEAKPVDDDPMQQLIDQNRMQAMRAAIRLGEERLAKLRAPGAKQPREVVPESSKSQVLGFKFNPSGSDAEAACAGQSRECGAHFVNHPRGLCFGNSAGCKLTPNTARHNTVERPVLMTRVDAATRATIPKFAPQVVAALQAR